MKKKWFISLLITLALIGSFFLGQQFSSEVAARSSTLWRSLLLKTGQTTSYVDYDDGYYKKGIAKSYTVLTTGQFSSTSTIKLAHYTSAAGAITFSDALDTIVDTGAGLAIFLTGDVIYTNTPNNLGPFTITTGGVAGTITCTGATFTSETPAGAVTFYKAETHSNACVLDNNTGLMWSQTVSNKMGAVSDGKLPWTTVAEGYGIYPYVVAANVAGLGGYSDWKVCNFSELLTLVDFNVADPPHINATAFPSFPGGYIWTSTTHPEFTTYAMRGTFGNITFHIEDFKTVANFCLLVRGG